MSGERLEHDVAESEAGIRLDLALARLTGVGSRAAAQRLLEAGRVSVDGDVRTKGHRLRAGARIEARLEDRAPPIAPGAGAGVSFEVLHEDEHLLVVDKPAGIVVHPAPGHASGTLSQALADRGAAAAEPWRPGVVHRLDRHTSGLLVVAKDAETHRALQAAIRRREVRREYLALVEDHPGASTGTIEAPLGRDRADRTAISLRTDRPRDARTHFAVEEALATTTLLTITLDTGRTHQIRVHLAAIGNPVCGDRRYGGAGPGRVADLARQFLHAARLELAHPTGGGRLDLRSGLPDDLARALQAARGAPGAPAGRRGPGSTRIHRS